MRPAALERFWSRKKPTCARPGEFGSPKLSETLLEFVGGEDLESIIRVDDPTLYAPERIRPYRFSTRDREPNYRTGLYLHGRIY